MCLSTPIWKGDDSDFPWAGPKQTVDLKPQAKVVDDWVFGLGSSNPKAMVSTLTEVATALLEAKVPLKGDTGEGLPMAACRSPFRFAITRACLTVSSISSIAAWRLILRLTRSALELGVS